MNKICQKIYLEPNQEILLKRIADEMDMTESELIQTAIRKQIMEKLSFTKRDMSYWDKERDFIKYLIEQGSVHGKRKWRREEIYER